MILALLEGHLESASRKITDRKVFTRIRGHAMNLMCLLSKPDTLNRIDFSGVAENEEYSFLKAIAQVPLASDLPPEWQAYLARYLSAAELSPYPEVLEGIPTYSYGNEFKDIICPNAFMYLELRANGDLSPCCYLPFVLGNIRQTTLEKLWHSPVSQALRQSIKDGSFIFCDKRKCAGMQKVSLGRYISNRSYQIPYELFQKKDLKKNGLGFLAGDAPEGRVPSIISFDDDPTCNLACPSCRKAIHAATTQEAEMIYQNDRAILDAIPLGIQELWFSGAGDPIASRVYRKIFSEFEWRNYPSLKIRLDTNGLLLTEGNITGRLSNIVDKIYLIAVSVDATKPEIYSAIRKGGNFSKLLANLANIASPERNMGKKLVLRMIVQSGNFMEMGDFVDLGKKFGADTVVFSAIANWGTFDKETFLRVAVHNPASPFHQKFKQILLDPRLRDPIVDMGNLTRLFHDNLVNNLATGIKVQDVVNPDALLPFGKRARIIAFYLPQFHPIPENDIWWGKGFTEWTNMAKAQPFFEGHCQPHLPADLGFYDLRVSESREAQAELARSYSIDAFCYWHYWFAGKQLLERPFKEVVESGRPDFPFCLGWANQTWSGIWHGSPGRILIEQTYPGLEDYKAHFDSLVSAFRDSRYFRINGKLLFLIYAPHNLPDAREFTDYWQELAHREGLAGFHFIAHMVRNPEAYGCQTCVANAPFMEMNAHILKVKALAGGKLPQVYHYEDLVRHLKESHLTGKEHPLVIPNWDNTPRSGTNGLVLHGSTPELFGEMMDDAIAKAEHMRDPAERIVFIKAWNEWAEGNHLEPDLLSGHGYLQAVHHALFPE